MILIKDVHITLPLIISVMILGAQPTSSGIANYVPSLSGLNPLYWFGLVRRSNPEARDTINRSDDHSPAPPIEVRPKNIIHSGFQGLYFNTTQQRDTSYLVSTRSSLASTPAPTSPIPTSAHNSKLGPIASLFTTQKPATVKGYPSGQPMRVQIKKKGKLYETPINTSMTNLTATNDPVHYSRAFDFVLDENKQPQPIEQFTRRSEDRDDTGNPRSTKPVNATNSNHNLTAPSVPSRSGLSSLWGWWREDNPSTQQI